MSEPVKRIEFELTELGKVYVLATDYDALEQQFRELEAERDELVETNNAVVSTSYTRLLDNDTLRAEVADLKAHLLEAERGNESCCGCGRRGASSR